MLDLHVWFSYYHSYFDFSILEFNTPLNWAYAIGYLKNYVPVQKVASQNGLYNPNLDFLCCLKF